MGVSVGVGVLALAGAGGAALERTALGTRLSAPVLAMVFGAAAAAALPEGALGPALAQTWESALPAGAVLLLLDGDVAAAVRGSAATRVTLVAFVIGAVGTALGTAAAWVAAGAALGSAGLTAAACLAASYVGGSLNFAAVAKALGGADGGASAGLAAAMAADNLAMAGFIALIMSVPAERSAAEDAPAAGSPGTAAGDQAPTPGTLVGALAAAGLVVPAGEAVARAVGLQAAGLAVAAALAAAVAAAAAAVSRRLGAKAHPLRGASALGGALMLVFFAAVGAAADPRVAANAGAPTLAFIAVQLGVHLAVVLGVGRALGLPTPELLVASNANVGGPATAAAFASSRGWGGLVQPALVAGTLGYLVGTPVGLALHRTLPALPTIPWVN